MIIYNQKRKGDQKKNKKEGKVKEGKIKILLFLLGAPSIKPYPCAPLLA